MTLIDHSLAAGDAIDRGLNATEHAEILELIVRRTPMPEVLSVLVRRIEQRAPGVRCSVLLVEDGILRHAAAPSLPNEYMEAIDGTPIGEGVGSCGTAAYRCEPVVVRDIATDALWEDFRSLALPHGLRACWSSPIVAADGSVLGTFAVYYSEPREPSDEERWLVASATNLAAIAIENSRAEQVRVALVHEQEARIAADSEWERLRELLQEAPAPIAVLRGPDFTFEVANAAYSALVGRTTADLVGRRVVEVLPEVEEQGFIELLRRVYATGEPLIGTEMPVRIRRGGPTPDQLFVTFVYKATRDRAGVVDGIFVHAIDVTDSVQARQRVEALAAAAQRASAAKDEFLGMMSHELRTPLTVINGGAQILERRLDELPPAARAEMITDIRRESERLLSIVDNLLVLARVDEEPAQELEPCRIGRLVRNVVNDFQRRNPERTISFSAEEKLPLVACRGGHFEQVMRNLLANALKYTPAGSPVDVRCERAEGGSVRVTVADRGPGVPPEELDIIFDRFYRSRRTEKLAGGSGLGLAICRRLLEMMGGTICAKNRDGGGLELSLELCAYADEGD